MIRFYSTRRLVIALACGLGAVSFLPCAQAQPANETSTTQPAVEIQPKRPENADAAAAFDVFDQFVTLLKDKPDDAAKILLLRKDQKPSDARDRVDSVAEMLKGGAKIFAVDASAEKDAAVVIIGFQEKPDARTELDKLYVVKVDGTWRLIDESPEGFHDGEITDAQKQACQNTLHDWVDKRLKELRG